MQPAEDTERRCIEEPVSLQREEQANSNQPTNPQKLTLASTCDGEQEKRRKRVHGSAKASFLDEREKLWAR